MIGKISRGKSFQEAIEYAFKEKKKALLVYSNLAEGYQAPETLNPLIKAFTSHAQLYQSTAKPVYKIAISPAQGDHLTPYQWGKLCREAIHHMGLGDHQAIAVLYRDTCFKKTQIPRPHVHIIANAVGDDGRCGDFFLGLPPLGRFLASVRAVSPAYSSCS